jgi:hypothetical protein
VEAVNWTCYRFEARASGSLGFWCFHLGIKFTIFLPVFPVEAVATNFSDLIAFKKASHYRG